MTTTQARPYTDSILGPLTPWSTKVGDVICDTCGKIVITDVKLKDLHDIDWLIVGARNQHLREMMKKERPEQEAEENSPSMFFNLCLGNWHSQYTLKWVPIIEQKLKEKGIF